MRVFLSCMRVPVMAHLSPTIFCIVEYARTLDARFQIWRQTYQANVFCLCRYTDWPEKVAFGYVLHASILRTSDISFARFPAYHRLPLTPIAPTRIGPSLIRSIVCPYPCNPRPPVLPAAAARLSSGRT